MREVLKRIDHTPCRLPPLEEADLTDPAKGVWELFGEDPALCRKLAVLPRNPRQDVQNRAVAIDFGTSSTVVACDTASGARELLRIGVRDFYAPIEPRHFENPTVLECLDFRAFQTAWGGTAYRPPLNWDWMRGSHEAQASFRDNPGDTRILASILPRLKQWALRNRDDRRVLLTDRRGVEVEIAPHTERNPVRGQPLRVAADDPFDPIELYAWYLGMAVNWRQRGLFFKYYLSFPVKYPRDVRDRILASFRRGLQRSLPPTLVAHFPEVLNDFTVEELASEPAAYAAAALAHLGIEPTEEGVPYAVYDFGGGTTDFDFGLMRWANEEEEGEGYEKVFEHWANGGDEFLGGENLLEHLAYLTFQDNLDILRRHRIQFTRPLDARPFAGSEAFLAPTQAAQTNTVMLCSRLRPFLEGPTAEPLSQIKIDLIDTTGNKQLCELALDTAKLDAFLLNRIRAGVEAFLAQLAGLHTALPKAPIHVLLAGNASLSRHIQQLFDAKQPDWQELLKRHFGEEPPEIVVHPPLPVDEKHPHAPTAKTGVALGLLRLAPGENTKLIDRVSSQHEGQAPFGWFVGRMRRGQFEYVLSPQSHYQPWHELGPLQQGVFNLYFTRSPRAHSGMREGDPELVKHRREFPAAAQNSKLYVRAVHPHEIELAIGHASPDETTVERLKLE